MKRFLLSILVIAGVPMLIALGLYLWTDPFRTLHPFDINDTDATNREYASTELFRRNHSTYHYNAFVFGSSQASGLNTYTWALYLPDSASTFLFQAYAETITGVKQKVEWLDKQNAHIDYSLVLIDIPGFFSNRQYGYEAVSMKHWRLSGEPEWLYHTHEYLNFLQRPSFWWTNIKRTVNGVKEPFDNDTVTNDFFAYNRYHYDVLPPQDSLKNCSEVTRRTFFAEVNNRTEADVKMSKAVINSRMQQILCDIKAVFDKQHTDYHIIITPAYRYVHPYLNTADLEVLQHIFGKERVWDFTTDPQLTSDYNDFFDPVHFGTRLGWYMLQDIYGSTLIEQPKTMEK
ncbi:MAG: hypothetical protein IJS00_02065 [Paludibacteraceae bacterium]|nr:hypothetical protein [Paludibacteraceae bacterium]